MAELVKPCKTIPVKAPEEYINKLKDNKVHVKKITIKSEEIIGENGIKVYMSDKYQSILQDTNKVAKMLVGKYKDYTFNNNYILNIEDDGEYDKNTKYYYVDFTRCDGQEINTFSANYIDDGAIPITKESIDNIYDLLNFQYHVQKKLRKLAKTDTGKKFNEVFNWDSFKGACIENVKELVERSGLDKIPELVTQNAAKKGGTKNDVNSDFDKYSKIVKFTISNSLHTENIMKVYFHVYDENNVPIVLRQNKYARQEYSNIFCIKTENKKELSLEIDKELLNKHSKLNFIASLYPLALKNIINTIYVKGVDPVDLDTLYKYDSITISNSISLTDFTTNNSKKIDDNNKTITVQIDVNFEYSLNNSEIMKNIEKYIKDNYFFTIPEIEELQDISSLGDNNGEALTALGDTIATGGRILKLVKDTDEYVKNVKNMMTEAVEEVITNSVTQISNTAVTQIEDLTSTVISMPSYYVTQTIKWTTAYTYTVNDVLKMLSNGNSVEMQADINIKKEKINAKINNFKLKVEMIKDNINDMCAKYLQNPIINITTKAFNVWPYELVQLIDSTGAAAIDMICEKTEDIVQSTKNTIVEFVDKESLLTGKCTADAINAEIYREVQRIKLHSDAVIATARITVAVQLKNVALNVCELLGIL